MVFKFLDLDISQRFCGNKRSNVLPHEFAKGSIFVRAVSVIDRPSFPSLLSFHDHSTAFSLTRTLQRLAPRPERSTDRSRAAV